MTSNIKIVTNMKTFLVYVLTGKGGPTPVYGSTLIENVVERVSYYRVSYPQCRFYWEYFFIDTLPF